MVPWDYGLTSAECAHSWVFCRIQAFASQAACTDGNSLVCVGDPVVGFVEPTNRKPKSAHLTGWSKTSLEFWRLPSPASFPIKFALNGNALYCLPHLSDSGFSYVRQPKCNFIYLVAPSRGPSPAFAEETARDSSRAPSRRGRDRNRSQAPRPNWHVPQTDAAENPNTSEVTKLSRDAQYRKSPERKKKEEESRIARKEAAKQLTLDKDIDSFMTADYYITHL